MRGGRHLVVLVLLGVTALGLVVALPAIGANGPGARLTKHERELIAEARAEGKSTIIVMVAAKGGAARDAIRELESLGGVVQFQDAALGYIRASLPLDKVAEASQLASVEALDVDETVPLPGPGIEGVSPLIPQATPNASTPRSNPYMPTQRHRRGAVRDGQPDVGRPRRHDRRRRQRRDARPSEPR